MKLYYKKKYELKIFRLLFVVRYMKSFLLITLLFFQMGCLKPRKSLFDFNSSVGGGFIGFGFLLSLNSRTDTGTGTGTAAPTFSVGGNITGYSSGTLVLQLNGGADLTLTPTSTYSFSGTLASGTTYTVSVKSHPLGLSCSLSNQTGTITSNISNANITCTNFVAKAQYDLGDPTKSYWLDYVKSNGTNPLNATGVTCDPAVENGFYNACIHAGEIKKFSVPNITSCDGITAEDHLKTLNWNCFVQNGVVNIFSTGLRADKGLSDLIDFTGLGSWRDNFVIVTRIVSGIGTRLMQSNPAIWWDNPIVVRNDGAPLNTPYNIAIVNNNSPSTDDYVFGSGKTSLLVQPGILKQFLTNSQIKIQASAANFTWIEGSFQAGPGPGPGSVIQYISLQTKFHMLRNFKAIGVANINTINITHATASMFHNVSGTNLINTGGIFISVANNKNILNNITAYNLSNKGIHVVGGSDNIFLNSFSTNSNGIGVSVSLTVSNLLLNIAGFNSNSPLVFLDTTASSTTMMNSLAINANNINAIVSNSNNPKFINTIAANSTNNDISNGTISSINSIFKGIFKVKIGNCIIALAINPGINVSCDKQNLSDNISTIKGISIDNSFVGKVTTNDTKNSSDSNGSAAYMVGNDWLNFDNRFRAWGKQGLTFPDATNTGRCQLGDTCQIWDWSLKSNDTIVRNVNFCPNGSIVETHIWENIGNQGFCDSNYKGSVSISNTCITTFLRNAIEIFGDGVGNENGICESGEECMYTPNIGAYQGHSADSTNPSKLVPANQVTPTTNTCSDITTGTVSNVKLWKYEVNGY